VLSVFFSASPLALPFGTRRCRWLCEYDVVSRCVVRGDDKMASLVAMNMLPLPNCRGPTGFLDGIDFYINLPAAFKLLYKSGVATRSGSVAVKPIRMTLYLRSSAGIRFRIYGVSRVGPPSISFCSPDQCGELSLNSLAPTSPPHSITGPAPTETREWRRVSETNWFWWPVVSAWAGRSEW
jgi:hypothetical protein